jgi:hypothetical protein
MLMFSLITVTFAEIFLALIALLQNSSLLHVALIYGTQLVLIDGFILSSRNRLKREVQAQSTASNQQVISNTTDRATRVRLLLYIVVNASVPVWTVYFAAQFPVHFKIMIAVISLIFLNVTLFLSFRSQDSKMKDSNVSEIISAKKMQSEL